MMLHYAPSQIDKVPRSIANNITVVSFCLMPTAIFVLTGTQREINGDSRNDSERERESFG